MQPRLYLSVRRLFPIDFDRRLFMVQAATRFAVKKATHPLHTDKPTEFLRVIFNFLGEPFIRTQ